jgi:sialate O-acetylesterase
MRTTQPTPAMLRPSSFLRLLAAVLALGAANALPAQTRLAHVFGDHMVLQREQPLRIDGHDAPGTRVVVRFADQEVAATAGADGAFMATLAPLAASTTGRELVVTGSTTVRLADVVVGDVWLCSGQSNMAWGLGGCDARADIEAAALPAIRYRPYFEHFAGEPQSDLRDRTSWRAISPETAADCTAVGFYFARAVQPVAGVPIGLLTCTVGGTEIECWMPPAAFTDFPANRAIGDERQRRIVAWQQALAAAVPAVEGWTQRAKDAIAAGATIPPPPHLPLHPNEDRSDWHRTQSLYNGMVHPLVRFPVRGVLWYQGENNGHEQDAYVAKFTALVTTWRQLWGRELPFYFVQLANYDRRTDDPAGGDGFAPCRMAQLLCTRVAKTGMAVAIDVGDGDDIHPRNKYDVGLRLARHALANEYAQRLDPSGPLFAGCEREGQAMRVRFDHAAEGLMVGRKRGRDPVVAATTDAPSGFAIAGADRRWHHATARIDGSTVVVHSDAVPEPVAVRYAHRGNPDADLYDRDGLPSSPFRSDAW